MFPTTGAGAGAAMALALALTATSLAVAGLPTNSVGTEQIKKHAVHKSDIDKGAVSPAKIAKSVVRIDAAAVGTAGSLPSPTPDLSLATATVTTTKTGRVFAYGRGLFQASCIEGGATLTAGLYLDGRPLLASGTSMTANGPLQELNLFGISSSAVAPGVHTLEIKSDCLPGSFIASTTTGDAALGAFALRN